MAEVKIAKCPNCGGDLKDTKVSMKDGRKSFHCRNCREVLGIIKE
jgi:formamidopyrimidine-DNA glycosylase